MAAQKKTRPKAWVDTKADELWKKVDGRWWKQQCILAVEFSGGSHSYDDNSGGGSISSDEKFCEPCRCALAAVNAESVWLCCGAGISYDRIVDKPFED